MRRPSLPALATAATISVAVAFIFIQLQPQLVLANTTPAGGDMGAHVWGPAYLRDHLLPQGRLSGWSPDWYAGFPWLTFYFPIPSLLIVALDVILPYGIAFKLVSILGLLTLPVAAWAMGRLAGTRAPVPACLAVATLPFLFDRSFTIYGGNIPSTLAGEFAFSISLSLCLVFLGVLARGLQTGRHRATAAGLLALTGVCHVVPVFFALGGMAVMTLLRPDRHRLRFTITSGAVGGLLAAFWVLPFWLRIDYTNDMGWEKVRTFSQTLVGDRPQWLLVLALAGVVAAVATRERFGVFLVAMAGLSAAAFVLAPQGRLWNARLLPFWTLTLYLLAGYGIGQVAQVLAGDRTVARTLSSVFTPLAAVTAALLVVALPLQLLPDWSPVKTQDQSFIPTWARWNYTGYERKAAYPEYQNLIETMRAVGRTQGCGRAMWEYEPELDRLGTPMALMLLPYWTDGCVGSMEGLFFESSATTPYHFLNQSELSQTPSRAQRALPYRNLDLTSGIQHLQLLGVRYYMAISEEAKAQAASNPALTLLATSGPWSVTYSSGIKERTWEIFEVAGADLVTPLSNEPVVMQGVDKGGKEWLAAAVDWYQDATRWDVPLAASGPPGWVRVQGADPDPPRRSTAPVTVSGIETSDDSISFDVDRPGTPVLVKASYFPNWKVKGAKGVWRVTPNQMVVIPTETHVELYYGHTPVDAVSWLLTGMGLIGLFLLWRTKPIVYPQAPEPAEAPDEADPDRLSDEDEERLLLPVMAGDGFAPVPDVSRPDDPEG